MRFNLAILFILGIVLSYAQKPANSYHWKHLGPQTIAESLCDSGRWTGVGQGWIEDIIIEDDLWIAGTITGGLYRSTNNGKKWNKIDKDTLQFGTTSLLLAGDMIYRGTGLTHYDKDLGIGILKSKDKGKTWQETGLKFDKNERNPVWDIACNTSKKVLAACTPTQVYFSMNSGDTWELLIEDKEEDFKTVLFHSSKPDELWIGGKSLRVANLSTKIVTDKTPQLSANTEDTNKEISRIAICQDPNNDNRFLAFYGLSRSGVLDESLDGGKTWHVLNDGKRIERADRHHTEVAIAPGNSNVIVLGTFRTYLSIDNGKSFTTITHPGKDNPRFAHDDIRELSIKSDQEFYIATDGGIFGTLDGGDNWENLSGKGLVGMQIYGIDILADNSVLMGTQDMGYFSYHNGEWSHLGLFYGDGGDALQIGDKIYIIMGGRLRQIDNIHAKRYSSCHPPTGTNPFTAKLYKHPIDSTLYYVGHRLWHYHGESWTNLSKGLGDRLQMIMDIDINDQNPNQMFFAYDQPTWNAKKLSGKFFKSINGGESWTDITQNLPILAWHYITSISSNPTNPNKVYVSLGKMDDSYLNKVYKSEDGGITWKNVSAGIPPFETFKIEHISNSSGVVLASLGGLFYKNDMLDQWIRLEGKIPPIAIRDFMIDIENRKIIASTYGNGLWQMKMPRRMLRY
ncbi:MAG: photosystem II stability/assembly factor-like uncharacterized protein [Bacteroidia bacterium]|jgi:photosystem II stability/assembly factor-like uncharacterized protein